MIYLDALDSVRSAHTQTASRKFWQPQEKIDQVASVSIAESSIMLRLLMGETIGISNNQMIDSVAWLSLAQKMSELKRILTWQPFRFVYYEKGIDTVPSASLHKLLVDSFSNPKYEFSAWANLDQDQKQVIVQNLKNPKLRISEMIFGLSNSLDRKVYDQYSNQAEGLEYVYSYLSDPTHTNEVCVKADISTKKIWTRIEKLRDVPNGISGEIIDEIHAVLVSRNEDPEGRSNLYHAVENLQLNDLDCERLRMYIDRFYNEKLAVSVTNGRGEFTMVDHTPDTTIQEDSVEDEIADQMNDPRGLLSHCVYEVGEDTHEGIDALTWETMVQLFKEEKDLLDSAVRFQRRIKEYYVIKPHPNKNKREYQNWHKNTEEELQKHKELLATKLGTKVACDSKTYKFITKIRSKADMLLGTAAGIIIGAADIGSIGERMFYAGLTRLLGSYIVDESSSLIQDMIESRSIGRIRASVDDIKLQSDEELLR